MEYNLGIRPLVAANENTINIIIKRNNPIYLELDFEFYLSI